MDGVTIFCICGRKCTSKPGFTLHQKRCEQAQLAKNNDRPTTQKSDLVKQEFRYIKEVQILVDLMKEISIDSHNAITKGNKAAGVRARLALLQVKNRIIPLRKQILKSIK